MIPLSDVRKRNLDELDIEARKLRECLRKFKKLGHTPGSWASNSYNLCARELSKIDRQAESRQAEKVQKKTDPVMMINQFS